MLVSLAIFPALLAIYSNHVKMQALVGITIVHPKDIFVSVLLDSMAVNVNSIFAHVNQTLVGTMVEFLYFDSINRKNSLILGTCLNQSNTEFLCICVADWMGIHCETIVNYCQNITCQNNGVCRSLFGDYKCECLGDSYSGRHCEITKNTIYILQIVSKSFASIAIIFIISVFVFVGTLDVLKHVFHIDPVEKCCCRSKRQKRGQKKNQTDIVLTLHMYSQNGTHLYYQENSGLKFE